MQNKCNCGCQSGFVPADSNWAQVACQNFNMNGDCGRTDNQGRSGNCQNTTRSNRSRSRTCGECENTYTRTRNNDRCQCERCDDSRTADTCEQNTRLRDTDTCETRTQTRSGCTGKANCTCDNCTRSRTRNTDCDCEQKYYGSENASYSNSRSRSDYGYENGSGYAHNRSGVGMVKGTMQKLENIFQSESALRAGTLFPELHKPLNGYCPCDSNCGTCDQAAAFAAWEIRLYLNTHPNDKEALALFRKLCKEAEEENYATTFLEDDCCTDQWNWVRNPWPWEYSCKCGD